MTHRSRLYAIVIGTFCAGGLLFAFEVHRPPEIPFEKITIDLGSSESAAVADINGDGKLDIVSGENWYEAPGWKQHHFRDLYYTNNYIDDLSTVPLDVDEDGKVDLVTSGWFSKKLAWWKNPGGSGKWIETPVETTSPIEFTFLVDLRNSGNTMDVLPQFGDLKAPLAWYERRDHTLVKHVVSSHSYGHGIGAGDVNGDGRTDILTPQGWLEAPADIHASGDWTFHPDWHLGDLGFIYVRDVNGDGRPDLITSMAHNYGIFWMEHPASGAWIKHLIDDSWSQAHAVTIVDFRGGANPGLLTGKRFMAHNGHDPGEREPLGVYWYEPLAVPGKKEPEWVRHVIDYSTRTGGGLQIPGVDIDGDGDLDFVVAGKSGLFLFVNKTK